MNDSSKTEDALFLLEQAISRETEERVLVGFNNGVLGSDGFGRCHVVWKREDVIIRTQRQNLCFVRKVESLFCPILSRGRRKKKGNNFGLFSSSFMFDSCLPQRFPLKGYCVNPLKEKASEKNSRNPRKSETEEFVLKEKNIKIKERERRKRDDFWLI